MSKNAKFAWLATYACTLAALVWGTLVAREQVLVRLSTPEAEQEWTEWREAAQKQANTGPVARRPPKTAEPPALILMRDYFPAVLTAGIVFGTFLFAILFVAARSLWPASAARAGSITIGQPRGGPI